MSKLAPSILSADFSRLGKDIKEIEQCDIEILHIDVMDGRFVPNISIGFPIIKSIRKNTDMVFDVHLMVEEPLNFIDQSIEAGADIITIHCEATKHIDKVISYIKTKGKLVGVSINPGAPINMIISYVHLLDVVLVMTVNPGLGNQCLISYTVDKIKQLSEPKR